MMAKYVLTDYHGVLEDEKPFVKVLKNKNALIEQLLDYLDDDISLEVIK